MQVPVTIKMDIEIVKENYDASGVTMVLSVKMAYGEPLPPIPGFPDEQMPPPQFELLKAVLGREISALFWGRNRRTFARIAFI
jgi:hypothetical protein